MYNDRIVLTAKDILENEFKIDARGYRLQEVDKYKNSFSPWSEYNWDEEKHYLCYNLGYLKERR